MCFVTSFVLSIGSEHFIAYSSGRTLQKTPLHWRGAIVILGG